MQTQLLAPTTYNEMQEAHIPQKAKYQPICTSKTCRKVSRTAFACAMYSLVMNVGCIAQGTMATMISKLTLGGCSVLSCGVCLGACKASTAIEKTERARAQLNNPYSAV